MTDVLDARNGQAELRAAARDNRQRITCVEGKLGTGKTTLLAEMARQADTGGFRVLIAQGSMSESDFPFGVVDQLFAGKLDDFELTDMHRALRYLSRYLRNLATHQPVFIGVDNVDKADEPSLRWLSFMRRRLADLPVTMVFTCGPVRSSLVNELTGPVERIRLTGLDPGGCARMIGDAPDEYVHACYLATGGNPYLLRELLAASAPRTVEGIELAAATVANSLVPRLAGYGPHLVAMAKAVALLGSAGITLAAEVAGLDVKVATAAARQLADLGFVGDEPLAMTYPIARMALLHTMTSPEREAAHNRAARYLHRRGEPAGEHLLASAPIGQQWAVQALRTAARGESSPDRAVRYLRRLLQEPLPDDGLRAEVLAELGTLESHLDPDAAFESLKRARAQVTDPVEEARLTLTLAYEIAERQDRGRAVATLDQATASVAGLDRDLGHTLRLYATRLILEESCVDEELPGRFAQLRAEPAMSAKNELFLSALLAFRDCLRGDDPGRAAILAKAAPARLVAGAVGDIIDRATFTHLVITLMIADELDLALKLCEDAFAATASREVPVATAQIQSLRTHLYLRAGRLADAESAGLAALRIFDQLRLGRQRVVTLAVTGLCSTWAEMGEPGRADELFASHRLDGAVPEARRFDRVLYHRGIVRSRLGDHGGALLDLLECGRRLAKRGVLNPGGTAWRSHAAEQYLALGRPAEALRLAEEEVALARRWGRPRALGGALRVAGLAAKDNDLVAESVRVLNNSTARLQLARSLLSWGGVLPQADRRAVYRRAHDLAKACGAVPIMTMAANELRAAGGRRSRRDSCALTDQEMCVASMAVRGQTNREIAAELYVTQRAVEQHLTKAYRKLGIAGRPQLAAALRGQGPDADQPE
ncbi:helix-turn-helix transcriptional regulator [Actinocrispum wychmicini]|uniref:AAA ATPase-like protein n=1 Tax=Actinocrispum wychmicini TaxID=1213861 RepID=A0A4V2S963_9PSEU|nr:LuxR C-terminal-related transcriptional regulator [Actinocrispum wychmicini]TCO65890.1 AAA ATPase-like protein [Actinocrispum wychmicini]